MFSKPTTGLFAVGLSLVMIGIAASFAAGGLVHFELSPDAGDDSANRRSDPGAALDLAPFAKLPCDKLEPPPIAVLGRLAPGYNVTSLEDAGYKAVRAIEGAEDDLVVIDPIVGPLELSEGAPLVVQQLQSNPALLNVALLRARATDLSLRSCWYTLDDKPAAVDIATRATDWMVQNGVLTREQVEAGGTTYGLTDDPTDPSHLLFSVLLAKPGGGIPGSADEATLTLYVAVIDRATGDVLSAGRGYW